MTTPKVECEECAKLRKIVQACHATIASVHERNIALDKQCSELAENVAANRNFQREVSYALGLPPAAVPEMLGLVLKALRERLDEKRQEEREREEEGIGQVVSLRCGGPKMIVVSYDGVSRACEVAWHDAAGCARTASFPRAALVDEEPVAAPGD